MMYCTGGIRCDVYSTVLREQGYDNVFTLEGGVQAYFDAYGKRDDCLWDDQLFVFDSRLAMTRDGRPSSEAGDDAATLTCHCCSEKRAPPPHRNCPNVDCNRLFLVCPACRAKLGGFCCGKCAKASHARPPLLEPGRYRRFAHYAEGEAMSRSERRGDGRARRRKARRERKKRERERDHVWGEDHERGDVTRAVRVLEKAARDPAAFGDGPDGGGTLASRTRSIVKAAGLLDARDDDDDDAGGEVGARRARLRDAAEAIAAGKDVDLIELAREVEVK